MLNFPARVMIAACLLAGCDAGSDTPAPASDNATTSAPPGAALGTCWAKDIRPAVVETVTEQILIHPAEANSDGTIAKAATYRTETHQAIIRERSETWFETPCADVLTPEFIETLQRALAARGHYSGPVTGKMDLKTRDAIRRYQTALDLNSGTLSLLAARQMGLISVAEN